MKGRGKLSKAVRVVELSLLASIAIVAAAEGLARVFVPRPVQEWVQNPLLGPVRANNIVIERWTLDDPPRPVLFKTNCLGYRGSSMTTPEKPPGKKRVFFLGGSSVELAYLPEEETFPGRFEAIARERGVPCEVANTGVTALSAPYTLATLEHRVAFLEPDMVVVFDGFNDFNETLTYNWDPAAFYLSKKKQFYFRDWLVGASRLAAWIDDRARRHADDIQFRSAWKNLSQERMRNERKPPIRDILRGVPRFEFYLKRELEVCRAIKCPLVLLTVPTLYKDPMPPEEESKLWITKHGDINPDLASVIKGMNGYNDAIRRVAAEPGAILVDIDKAMPKTLELMYDDGHPTRKGCELIARAIADRCVVDGHLVEASQ